MLMKGEFRVVFANLPDIHNAYLSWQSAAQGNCRKKHGSEFHLQPLHENISKLVLNRDLPFSLSNFMIYSYIGNACAKLDILVQPIRHLKIVTNDNDKLQHQRQGRSRPTPQW
ncbi:hypothetical protein EON65_37660 [archaeon]|nr:MAG: hypothetical protein EON65_37660 [archaeon]